MEIHRVRCDRCKKEVDMERGIGLYYMSPKDWKVIENIQFCPKCAKIVDAYLKEMIK